MQASHTRSRPYASWHKYLYAEGEEKSAWEESEENQRNDIFILQKQREKKTERNVKEPGLDLLMKLLEYLSYYILS